MKVVYSGKLSFIIFFTLLFSSCERVSTTADLILFNGNIITVDSLFSNVSAIAIKADTVLAIGTTDQVLQLADKNTKLVDLEENTAIPGFNDSHAHIWNIGKVMMQVDLMHATSWDEVVRLVKKEAENALPGEWIQGSGWHQEKFTTLPEPCVDGYPVHTKLSEALPDNPVMLRHGSGHAMFVNKKTMELCGINKETPNPFGGKIVKDVNGNPTGVLEENAMNIVKNYYNDLYLAQMTREQRKNHLIKQIGLAEEECLSKGITSLSDAGTSFDGVDILTELADSGQLKIRLYIMLQASNDELKERLCDYKRIGYANNFLTVRAIKKYIDGALGARGGWMLEPYNDLNTYGHNITPIPVFSELAEIAISNDFQLCTHAIGDRGNREILNVYEDVFQKHPEKKDLRWRVEHAQHLNKEDIPRFAHLGVIASMQTNHCTSDASFVSKRLGDERAEEGAYVWRKIMDTGAIICNGTDAPVENVDPILNYYSAVTRKQSNGKTFYPEQVMTRMEALESYTINGAYASFEEDVKGSLVPGKLADITVLSKDILTIPEDSILTTKVLMTIVGGKLVWERK